MRERILGRIQQAQEEAYADLPADEQARLRAREPVFSEALPGQNQAAARMMAGGAGSWGQPMQPERPSPEEVVRRSSARVPVRLPRG